VQQSPDPQDIGGIFNITNRALVNDYSGVMNGIGDAMVRAANERRRSVAVTPLLANGGAGQTMRDGNPAFHTSRGNIAGTAAAITVPSVALAFQALRTQTGPTGERLALEPWGLLVHPAKELEARQVLATINATQTAQVNPFAGELELLIEPGLTSLTGWYVLANPATTDGLAVGYLDGMMQPQVLTRPSWNNLGQEMRLTSALDARFVQPIAWYRNAGA
jgi:hypothetical protein